MSVPEKLLGAGALVMALCCAILPLAGAALGGGLIAGTGTAGVIAGVVVLLAVSALVVQHGAPDVAARALRAIASPRCGARCCSWCSCWPGAVAATRSRAQRRRRPRRGRRGRP